MFIRDIGGISVGVYRFFSIIVKRFSIIKLESILSSRLFFISQNTKDTIDLKDETGKNKTLRQLSDGELVLRQSRFIDLLYL